MVSGALDQAISDVDVELMMCVHLPQCEVQGRQGVQLLGQNCYSTSNMFWVDYLCISGKISSRLLELVPWYFV
jgi:hypothetical protein